MVRSLTPRGFRGTALLVAATALLCGWAAPAAQASASAGGGLHADPAEGAALDLTGAALGQQARNLVLTVQAAAPIDPEQLSAAAGGELCARFEPADGAALRLCVTRSDTAWQLRVGARTVVAYPIAGVAQLATSVGAEGPTLVPDGTVATTTGSPVPSSIRVTRPTGFVAGSGAHTVVITKAGCRPDCVPRSFCNETS